MPEAKSPWRTLFAKVADNIGKKVFEQITDHFSVDLDNRRIFLSHTAVEAIVRLTAKESSTISVEKFEPTPTGYACRIKTGTLEVGFVIMPEHVTWADGQVEAALSTPAGFDLPSNPVIDMFARAFIAAAGKPAFIKRFVQPSLPPEIHWDGEKVRCTFEVPTAGLPENVPQIARAAFEFSSDGRGLWLTFSSGQNIEANVVAIIKLVAKVVRGVRSDTDDDQKK